MEEVGGITYYKLVPLTKEGNDKTIKSINLIIKFFKKKNNNEFNSIVRIELSE